MQASLKRRGYAKTEFGSMFGGTTMPSKSVVRFAYGGFAGAHFVGFAHIATVWKNQYMR